MIKSICVPAELLKKRSQWQDTERVKRAFLPENVSSYLYDEASLTEKVKAYCDRAGQAFSVFLINETEQKPTLNERRYLHMRAGAYARVREIYLLCGKEKVIYARSVIPLTTMTGRQRQIRFLKNRSLGAYLFSDRTLQRDITQLARAQLDNKVIWGRRSLFRVDQKPLMVAEWFLQPEL